MPMLRPTLLFCLALFLSLAAEKPRANEIAIGVLAFQGSESAAQDFEPTIVHLRSMLPQHHFALVPLDLAGTTRAVETRTVDFVITNPGDYVGLEARFGVNPLGDAGEPGTQRARSTASARSSSLRIIRANRVISPISRADAWRWCRRTPSAAGR